MDEDQALVKGSDLKRRRQVEDAVVNGWEKLNSDILLKIIQDNFSILEFSNCGLADVCRDWLAICCDPALWTTLDLSNMRSQYLSTGLPAPSAVYLTDRSHEELSRLLKLAMRLSKKNTTTIICHYDLFLTNDMLTYTLKRCPNLRRLVLPAWGRLKDTTISNALSYVKNLESLTMPSVANPHFVFSSIVRKKKFRELKVMGPVDLFFAQNLVQHLPKLKVLSIRCTSIDRDALLKILEKLKSLETLNISHSYVVVKQQQQPPMHGIKAYGMKDIDEMIIEKASKLKNFLACKNVESCAKCHWAMIDDGNMGWNKYPKGVWKEDEISSLHL